MRTKLLENVVEALVVQMHNQKYLLALDQASVNTGWALFEKDKLIDYGVYTPKGEIEERLVQLRNWVLSFIEKYKNDIYIAIEDIQLQTQSRQLGRDVAVTTYRKLAWVQGVLIELFTSTKTPYEIVHSSSWKSTCNIKGANRDAQKANAALYVQNTFNISPSQDTCDAICIGQHILKNSCITNDFNWGM